MAKRPRTPASVPPSKKALVATIAALPLPAFILDADSRVAAWNDAAETLLGWSQTEMVGQNIPDTLGIPGDVRGPESPFLSGRPVTVSRRDGTNLQVQVSATSVRLGTNDAAHTVAIVQDVTAQQRVQQAFIEAQKMESLRTLAGGLAHDFHNLFAAMTGYAELLIADLEAANLERVRLDANEIRRGLERAAGVVRQLATFSGRHIVAPETVDLTALVRDALTLVTRLVGERIEVVTHLTDGLFVKVAPDQIQQVLLNLVMNSRDAMPHGGRLTIDTTRVESDSGSSAGVPFDETRARLTVADTGAGMDEATRVRAFEPFFTTKPAGGGTGLGLAMVYGVVARSGGFVTVDSAPGNGAEFSIYLPTVVQPSASPAAGRARDAFDGHETILLVEDIDAVRALVREALSRRGYRVLEAANAEVAFEVANTFVEPIDLLVTDLRLPGMSGMDLAAGLRATHADIRVLYMSGGVAGVAELDAELLQKPFAVAELAARVRSALDRPGANASKA